MDNIIIDFPTQKDAKDFQLFFITQVNEKEIPDFDICCAGFPCQSFSGGGKRLGFTETRGTFFDVERILKKKEPAGFILENVEGLVSFILTNLATKDENH